MPPTWIKNSIFEKKIKILQHDSKTAILSHYAIQQLSNIFTSQNIIFHSSYNIAI